jgi:hypothetical protein
MNFLLKFVLLTVLTVLASVCWALYFRFSHERKPYKAAFADCGIIMIGAINVVSYTEDHRLLGAILLGSFLGTVWAVKKKEEVA